MPSIQVGAIRWHFSKFRAPRRVLLCTDAMVSSILMHINGLHSSRSYPWSLMWPAPADTDCVIALHRAHYSSSFHLITVIKLFKFWGLKLKQLFCSFSEKRLNQLPSQKHLTRCSTLVLGSARVPYSFKLVYFQRNPLASWISWRQVVHLK